MIVQKTQWGNLRVATQLGNGIVIASAYDPAGRAIADSCHLGNGHSFQLQQLWDGAGNRRATIENYANSTHGSLFQYDSTDRLTSSMALISPVVIATNVLAPPTSPPVPALLSGQSKIDAIINGASAIPAAQPDFSYDAVGNRTRAGSVSYVSNARNEYVSAGAASFGYNAVGRLIADAKFTYAYNLRGQLIQAASRSNGTIGLQVFHDALGRPAGIVEAGRTRVLANDGAGAIESWDNGVLSAVYVREGRDQVCFFAAGGKDQYVLRDVLESTRLTTNSQGSAIGVFRYDPFGALLSGNPATPFLYSGKYQYASIGWYEYQRRQYIPSFGRFAQPDPAGFIDGPNLYSFVGNNPLSARDPNGTDRQNVPPAASDDERLQEVVVHDPRRPWPRRTPTAQQPVSNSEPSDDDQPPLSVPVPSVGTTERLSNPPNATTSTTSSPNVVPFWYALGRPDLWSSAVDPAVIKGFNAGIEKHKTVLAAQGLVAAGSMAIIGGQAYIDAAAGAILNSGVLYSKAGPVVIAAAAAASANAEPLTEEGNAMLAQLNQIQAAVGTRLDQQTLAILRTNGPDIVGAGVRDLSPAARALITNSDVVKLYGAHGERTVMVAGEMYMRLWPHLFPRIIVATNNFCPTCLQLILSSGAVVLNPRAAYWPP
jgi:RHS repeat-associated protein